MTELFEHMWWVVAIVSHVIFLPSLIVTVVEGVEELPQNGYANVLRLLSLIGVIYTWVSVVV